MGLRSARDSPISSGSVPIWLADDPCRRSAKRDHDGLLGTPCNSIQLGFSLRFSAADLGGFFEIEPRRVTATLPEIAIGLSRNSSCASVTGSITVCASCMSSSNRRLAMGSRLASMRSAASIKLPADTRRTVLFSIVRAHSCASGSSRGMAMGGRVHDHRGNPRSSYSR